MTEDMHDRMRKVRAAKTSGGGWPRDLNDKILQALRENRGPMSIAEISESIERSATGVRSAIYTLVEARKVRPVKGVFPAEFEASRMVSRTSKPASPRKESPSARNVARNVAAGHALNRIEGDRFRTALDELNDLTIERRSLEERHAEEIRAIEEKQRALLRRLAVSELTKYREDEGAPDPESRPGKVPSSPDEGNLAQDDALDQVEGFARA